MKKRILVRGPVLSRSGYGEHGTFCPSGFKEREKIDIDIFVAPTGWGKTGWLWEDNEERQWMDSLIKKTLHHQQNAVKGENLYDISIQVTIPNEWESEAGAYKYWCILLESKQTRVSPQWA